MISKSKILTEFLGGDRANIGPLPQPTTPETPNYRTKGPDIKLASPTTPGIKGRHCHTMQHWQRHIVSRLGDNNNGVYVIGTPGAGKTMPMFCYYLNNVLGLHTNFEQVSNVNDRIDIFLNFIHFLSEYIDTRLADKIKSELIAANIVKATEKIRNKLLILVPIISLADRTWDEFTIDFGNILTQMIQLSRYTDLVNTIVYTNQNTTQRDKALNNVRLTTYCNVINYFFNDTRITALNQERIRLTYILNSQILSRTGVPNSATDMPELIKNLQSITLTKANIDDIITNTNSYIDNTIVPLLYKYIEFIRANNLATEPQLEAIVRDLQNNQYRRVGVDLARIPIPDNLNYPLIGLIKRELENILISQRHRPIRDELFNIINTHVQDRLGYMQSSRRDSNPYSGESADHILHTLQNIDDEVQKLLIDKIKNIVENQLVGRLYEGSENRNVDTAMVMVSIYESSSVFFNKYKDKIALITCDESHVIQPKEDELLKKGSRAEQISHNLYPILSHTSKATKLLFLTGTIHPDSAKDFCDFIQVCFRKKIDIINVGQIDPSAGNPSRVTVREMNSLHKDDTLLNLLLRPDGTNNLIIIFSSKRMISLIKRFNKLKGTGYSLNQIDQGYGGKTQAYDGIKVVDYHPPGEVKKLQHIDTYDYREPSYKGTQYRATDLTNTLLRQSVTHGVGFLFRVDGKKPREIQEDLGWTHGSEKLFRRDFAILEQLFKKGVVHTIIATDVIGIGVNLDARNMFIPTSKRWDGEEVKHIESGDLSQLINRTGRAAFPISTVYTTSEGYPQIIEALSASRTGHGFAKRSVIQTPFTNRTLCTANAIIQTMWTRIRSHIR